MRKITLSKFFRTIKKARNCKILEKEKDISDVTRVFPEAPYPRSAVMQTLTRGESGSMLGLLTHL